MDKRDDELFASGADAGSRDGGGTPEPEEELIIDALEDLDDVAGEGAADSVHGDDFDFDFAEAEPGAAPAGILPDDQAAGAPAASESPELMGQQSEEEAPIEALLQDQEESGARRRLSPLLLLLLLLVIAAAAFFLVDRGGEQEAAPAPVASRKLPIEPPAPAPEQPVTEVVKRQQVASAVGGPSAAVAKGEPAVAAGTGRADGEDRSAEQQTLVRPKPVEAPAKPVGDGGTESRRQPMASSADEAVSGRQGVSAAGAPSAGYLVRVGAFILPANLRDALATVKKLGYESRVEEGKITRTVVRLRYGVYPRHEVRRHLDELKKVAPGAFAVYEGDEGAVYAGSFVSPDKARHYADLLWEQKRIRLDEVRADVRLPLKKVSIGPFADRAAARKAAEVMRQAGLEGVVAAP